MHWAITNGKNQYITAVTYIINANKRRPPCALYEVCLTCIVTRRSLTICYVGEFLHTHVLPIYQTVGNNFLFQQDNVSVPAIWQGTVCISWSCHTPLTGLLSPNPSRIDHPWDILGRRVHDCFPSQLPHFLNWNTSWLNNGNAFQKRGNNPRLLFSMRKRPMECIHKGGGHIRCYLQYI